MSGRRAAACRDRLPPATPVLLLSLLAAAACAPADGMDHALLDGILADHVSDGLMDYAALREDMRLPAYLDLLSRTTEGQVGGDRAHMTYWMNAYTACLLEGVLEHHRFGSAREVGEVGGLVRGFYRIPMFEVGGHDYSLNTVFHKIIRREFRDPRIHLALSQGTMGGPRLLPRAFHARWIERDLEAAARSFVRDPARVRLDESAGILELSPIFEWHRDEFVREAGTLRGFLWRYLPWDQRQGLRAPGLRIVFSAYDWRWNDAGR